MTYNDVTSPSIEAPHARASRASTVRLECTKSVAPRARRSEPSPLSFKQPQPKPASRNHFDTTMVIQ